jgi:hypothetical protein
MDFLEANGFRKADPTLADYLAQGPKGEDDHRCRNPDPRIAPS